MSVNTGHGLLVLTTAPGHGVDIHWVVILTQPVSVSVAAQQCYFRQHGGGTHLVQQGTGKHKNVIN